MSVPPDMPPEFELLDRYLRGEVDLESAARALAVDKTSYGVDFGSRPYLPEVDAANAKSRLWQGASTKFNSSNRWSKSRRPSRTLIRGAAPENPQNFSRSIAFTVRGRDGEREHTQEMRVYVCTPAWLADRVRDSEWTWLAPPRLVVGTWSPKPIREAIKALTNRGGDYRWQDLIERLSKYVDAE